jgi:hypothetical protein
LGRAGHTDGRDLHKEKGHTTHNDENSIGVPTVHRITHHAVVDEGEHWLVVRASIEDKNLAVRGRRVQNLTRKRENGEENA